MAESRRLGEWEERDWWCAKGEAMDALKAYGIVS